MIRATAAGWENGGFVPTAQDDAATRGQAVTVTAFPAEAPFRAGTMHTEPVTARRLRLLRLHADQAGTDDPISLTLDGRVIPLDPLWMPLSGSAWSAKENGHFDGYDLSPAASVRYSMITGLKTPHTSMPRIYEACYNVVLSVA